MVAHFCAIIILAVATLIMFMLYGLKHKAKGDGSFVAITVAALLIIISHGLNWFFLYLGDDYLLYSKIAHTCYIAFNTILIGLFTINKINTFADKTKYILLIKFIVGIVVFICCSLIFINIHNELFFTYKISVLEPFGPDGLHFVRIVTWQMGSMFNVIIFFWILLIAIYGLLAFIRIAIRGVINSVRDFFIIGIFIVQCLFFALFTNRTDIIILQSVIFAYLSPLLYYILIYNMKPLFIKRAIRSNLYEHTNDVLVIFNADNLLTDFNNSAKNFFGFSRKDIYNLTLSNFIKDYVPLGNVPSDSFSVEQIYIKSHDDENRICQLDFHTIKSFKKFTTCSFFIIHDISSIYQNFAEIQQSSMTDRITGLLAQHVLIKKIREINIFRRFPYSVASCSVHVRSIKPDVNENFALVKVAECIKEKIRGSDFASYENGNIVLLFPAEYNIAQNVMERIVSAIEENDYLKDDVSFQYGLTTRESPDEDIQQTINRAHAIMFKNKIESSIHGFSTEE